MNHSMAALNIKCPPRNTALSIVEHLLVSPYPSVVTVEKTNLCFGCFNQSDRNLNVHAID